MYRLRAKVEIAPPRRACGVAALGRRRRLRAWPMTTRGSPALGTRAWCRRCRRRWRRTTATIWRTGWRWACRRAPISAGQDVRAGRRTWTNCTAVRFRQGLLCRPGTDGADEASRHRAQAAVAGRMPTARPARGRHARSKPTAARIGTITSTYGRARLRADPARPAGGGRRRGAASGGEQVRDCQTVMACRLTGSGIGADYASSSRENIMLHHVSVGVSRCGARRKILRSGAEGAGLQARDWDFCPAPSPMAKHGSAAILDRPAA